MTIGTGDWGLETGEFNNYCIRKDISELLAQLIETAIEKVAKIFDSKIEDLQEFFC